MTIRNAIAYICIGFLLAPDTIFADCPQNVQVIKQGQTANCDGFLFSPSAESDSYKAKQLADLEKTENDILNERLQLYMKQSDALAKDVGQRDNSESLYRFGYFLLGAIITGYIAVNVRK